MTIQSIVHVKVMFETKYFLSVKTEHSTLQYSCISTYIYELAVNVMAEQ